MSGYAYRGKRVLDLVCASSLFIITLPVMAVIAAVILLREGRPIFFTQERVGRGGKSFRIFKFRSLVVGAGSEPVLNQTDARITKTGKLLRRTHLDELPQLINILIGDMSMVGPRPLTESDLALFSKAFPELSLEKRHEIVPGLTSPVYIHFGSKVAEMKSLDDFYNMAKEAYHMDVAYADSASFLGDLKILFQTFGLVTGQKGK